MATVTSNLDAISTLIGRLADCVDLTLPGESASLGLDLLGDIAVGIIDRSVDGQKAPDGSAWAENLEPYRSSRRKANKPIGVLSGEMLSLREVQGEVSVSPHEATMTYGTSDETKRRAEWFTRGSDGPGEGEVSGAKGQQPRPFYGLDPEIEATMTGRIERHIERTVRELGGS